VASAKVHGTTFAAEDPRVVDTFAEILDERPAFSIIAVNAPIGWVDVSVEGGRSCDRAARALLGPRRGAAVHSAPRRVEADADAEVTNAHLDAVSKKLFPRYRELLAEMAPYRQRSVYEVHSELSFYQLNGDAPLRWSKKSQQGAEERRALLEKRIPGVARILDVKIARVPYSHLLDVAGFVWTARRIFARAGLERLPLDPEWDESGLRMEIVR
jgi:predicted RNase H-like nuclease